MCDVPDFPQFRFTQMQCINQLIRLRRSSPQIPVWGKKVLPLFAFSFPFPDERARLHLLLSRTCLSSVCARLICINFLQCHRIIRWKDNWSVSSSLSDLRILDVSSNEFLVTPPCGVAVICMTSMSIAFQLRDGIVSHRGFTQKDPAAGLCRCVVNRAMERFQSVKNVRFHHGGRDVRGPTTWL